MNDLTAVAEEEQLRATGILQQLAGRELVSPPFSADGERIRYDSEPPLLGQHSREILAEAGYGEVEIDELVRRRRWAAKYRRTWQLRRGSSETLATDLLASKAR